VVAIAHPEVFSFIGKILTICQLKAAAESNEGTRPSEFSHRVTVSGLENAGRFVNLCGISEKDAGPGFHWRGKKSISIYKQVVEFPKPAEVVVQNA
jgi:hypothetical protein